MSRLEFVKVDFGSDKGAGISVISKETIPDRRVVDAVIGSLLEDHGHSEPDRLVGFEKDIVGDHFSAQKVGKAKLGPANAWAQFATDPILARSRGKEPKLRVKAVSTMRGHRRGELISLVCYM